MEYLIIVEKSNNGWGAYAPDLPGCVAVEDTKEKTIELMKEAIEFHIEGLKKDGDELPAATTTAIKFEVAI